LRDIIGCKTLTNWESISIYKEKNVTLPLSKTIGELGLSSDVCLTAKTDVPLPLSKEEPSGMWSVGDECEILCYDGQWRKGSVSDLLKDKRGLSAEVSLEDQTDKIHVSMWHKLLRRPGTGFQAPLPVATCHLPTFLVGNAVMVTVSPGLKKAAQITTMLGNCTQWRVRFEGEEHEDPEVYGVNDLEKAEYNLETNMRPDYFSTAEGGINSILGITNRINECEDEHSLQVVINDINDKLLNKAGDEVSALVASVLNRFRHQIVYKCIFAAKTELCIHLAQLLPAYEKAVICVDLPFDEGAINPISNPDVVATDEEKYLSGAVLTKNLSWDGVAGSKDVKIPMGARLVSVGGEEVSHLPFEKILSKVRDYHKLTNTVSYAFNIAGTDVWLQSNPGGLPLGVRFHRNSTADEENFQVNDVVYYLDGSDLKVANIIQYEGKGMYCILFIDKNIMEPPRQVHGSLLSKDPAKIRDGQSQSQPEQLSVCKKNITDSIYKLLEKNEGGSVAVGEVQKMLGTEYPDCDVSKVLGSSLVKFFDQSYLYELFRANEEGGLSVTICKLFKKEEAVHDDEKFCGPVQIPESDKEKIAKLREAANGMGIYPSEEQFASTVKEYIDLNGQINHLFLLM